MNKRLSLFFTLALFSLLAYAQWSEEDSLALHRVLNTDGEIKLNPNIIRQIDFGTFIGTPVGVDESSALRFDTTLPKVFPEKSEIRLTLRPYTANTKYNYDPIYRKKIDIDKDRSMKIMTIYSNWAKSPFDPGIRKSVEEIEATGVRYNPLANRVNNVAVGGWEPASGGGISTDLTAPFTKDFWDKKGRKRRARTLEVLRNYGDSTTVLIRE